MTLDEAKKVARDPWNKHEMHTLVEAVIALSDALRPAEGQVAAMREAAAQVAEDVAAQWSDVRARDVGACMTGIAKAIRAMPAPAARTDSPARTYEDGVRDAAKAVRSVETRIVHRRQELITEADVLRIARERSEACAQAVEALLSPASAPTPVVSPGCGAVQLSGYPCTQARDHDGAHIARDGCGNVMVQWVDKPKAFDAEAALVAMEQSIARRQHGPTPASRYEVYTAIQDGIAAGRGVK